MTREGPDGQDSDPELQLVEGPDRGSERQQLHEQEEGWKTSVWLSGSGTPNATHGSQKDSNASLPSLLIEGFQADYIRDVGTGVGSRRRPCRFLKYPSGRPLTLKDVLVVDLCVVADRVQVVLSGDDLRVAEPLGDLRQGVALLAEQRPAALA